MPMDEPPDLLYRLIVHELTHQFDYDIIPASLVRRSSPLWVHEGLADYMTGDWRPLDLMSVRDAAVADIIPKMSKLEGYSDVGGARMIYNLGHAIFEFIESKWGKEGLRQYLFSLRKSVIGGGEDAYEEAFKITADEFDTAVRQIPEGSLQAVPRQGAARRLRPQPRPESGEDAVPRRLHRRALAVGRSARGLHRQSPAIAKATSCWCRRNDGTRRPEADQGIRSEPRASSSSSRPAAAGSRCPGSRGRRRATGSRTSPARRSRGRSSCRTC